MPEKNLENNYAEILKSTFDKEFNAPLEAWKQFTDSCEAVHFKKDEVIKKENSIEKYFYFILRGSAGIFLWKESNFVCLDFAFDKQFCTDYMSLITQRPTPLQVIALEHSEMLRMTASDYKLLTQKSVGSIIRLISAEMSFVDKQNQQIELLTKTAEERYKLLLETYPDISNRIAQNHIASYLGITPQSLSRIRKARD